MRQFFLCDIHAVWETIVAEVAILCCLLAELPALTAKESGPLD
jgi:hypothetical protein